MKSKSEVEVGAAETPDGNYAATDLPFAATDPTGRDYLLLAEHLDTAGNAGSEATAGTLVLHPVVLHPALEKQRAAAAQTLRRIAAEPDRDVHQRIYHTLRLFVP